MARLDRDEGVRREVAVYQQLKADKQRRYDHWQRVLEYTFPHKAALTLDFTLADRPYRNKYDGMGMLAASEFAANLFTHLSPPNRRWFLLAPPAGSAADADRGYAEYLSARTEKLHLALAQPETNFETEIHGAYEDLALGTCCVAAKRGSEQPFVISTRPLSEYSFLTDDEGRISTVYVERSWTAAEAAKRFGAAKLPEEIRTKLTELDTSAYTQRQSYLNINAPNEAWEPQGLGRRGQRYRSRWVELGTNTLLEDGGTRRLRYIVARFWKAAGLAWGMGPSEMAYSWIRCLDKASEIMLKYAAKVMDPPSLWPDDGAFHPMATTPGSVIVGRMGAMDKGVPQYLQLQGDHRLAQFLFEYYSGLIYRAFMAEVFRLLTDNKERTAREVATILQKSYDLAIPVFGRLKAELFAPLLRLCLELLTEYELGVQGWRYGGSALPEYQYELELISPLALAIKYAELQKMSDLVVLNSQLAQVDAGVWDNYTLDEMSRGLGESLAVPHRWLRPLSERRALRERRAQLLAERAALEEAKLAAGAAKDLSKGAEPNSVMGKMMERAA